MIEEDKRISAEIKKLNKIFEYIPENKKKLCAGLIKNAAHMAITLEDLAAQVQDEGAVIESTNGNGFTTLQEHPAQKSYNCMINRYTATIRQLSELLPDAKTESAAKAGEVLAAFVAKGKPVDTQ